MGIAGLLPLLKDLHKPTHIKQFAGQRVAVDAYVWLHRGALAASVDLLEGKPTTNRREATRTKALELLKEGKKKEAAEVFSKALDVTPSMAHAFIKELQKAGVEFIVAPYEADAQMAYLEKKGVVSAVLTEDSDLLVYGCNNVIFKLEHTGECIRICMNDIGSLREFRNWDRARFRHLAILSGCDYLPSLRGIGLKTALKHLRNKDGYKLIKTWKMFGKAAGAPENMPRQFEEAFRRADQTFLHQRVYDSETGRLVHLTPIDETIADTRFLGPSIPDDVAKAIALGRLDPFTYKPFDGSDTDYSKVVFEFQELTNSKENLEMQGKEASHP
ncbi:Rad2 nuclease [Quaeritorhiza haematococci]|nr:Rad2 nuclease [Quaeritorhiza haematococci]